jgi:preprotein translocase subunit SecG
MVTLLAVLHIIFCLGLIAFVLLQDPKGGSAGGVFGGAGANTLLGTTGAANFLTKTTSWCAILFGITCLLMTILSKPINSSVIDTGTAAQHSAAPGAPVAGPVPVQADKLPPQPPGSAQGGSPASPGAPQTQTQPNTPPASK